MDIKEKIIKAFKDSEKPLRTSEVVEKTGLEKKDVEKTIKKLKDEGIIHSPKRCYLDLKH